MIVDNINEWTHYNLDLLQEILETQNKAVILIAGASSSGKSYASKILQNSLNDHGYKTYLISTDNYNKGLASLITEKVNKKYFAGKFSHLDDIISRVRKVIIKTDFSEKFGQKDQQQIKKLCKNYIDDFDMPRFLEKLQYEFSKVNFDEPEVYNLFEVAQDVNLLVENKTINTKSYSKIISEREEKLSQKISGKDVDVVIVEGIFALEKELIKNIDSKITIKNFIEGDAKTLFLRRVLRDAKTTSSDNVFTIKYYLENVVPSYNNLILPTKQNADLVLQNFITFDELIVGDKITIEEKYLVKDKKLIKKIFDECQIISEEYQKDIYYISKENTKDSSQNMLRLRLVSADGKEYKLSTLVHKGKPKYRKDGKVIRPVNVLIKEGEFDKIYSSFEELDSVLKNDGFTKRIVVEKKRTKFKLNNYKIVLDDVKNFGYALEVANQDNCALVQEIKENGKIFSSYYHEMCKGD